MSLWIHVFTYWYVFKGLLAIANSWLATLSRQSEILKGFYLRLSRCHFDVGCGVLMV